MPLTTVMLISLLSVSDEITITIGMLAFSSAFCGALAFFGLELVEKKIGKRRLKWPKDLHWQAVGFWGIAVIIYTVQLATLVNDFSFPNIYATLFNGGLVACGAGGFQTVVALYFVKKPISQRPRVNLTSVSMGLVLIAFDVSATGPLLLQFYSFWGRLTVFGHILAVLFIVSLVSSFRVWWVTWKKEKGLRSLFLGVLLLFSPYILILIIAGLFGLGM
jgi:hypothetical protein